MASMLTRKAGAYLKECRKKAGLTQREVAEHLNEDYYTLIAQLEAGHGAMPSHMYPAYSEALGVPADEFVKEMLRYYEPPTYFALFGTHPDIDVDAEDEDNLFAPVIDPRLTESSDPGLEGQNDGRTSGEVVSIDDYKGET